MADVTIRNLDQEILKHLEMQAQRHGATLEQELREILRRSSLNAKAPMSVEERLAFADSIRERMPAAAGIMDSTDIIRMDRDTNHGRYY